MTYNVYLSQLTCELDSKSGYQWINTTYDPTSIVYNTNNTPPTSFSITYNFTDSIFISIQSTITYSLTNGLPNGIISILNTYTCDNTTFTINLINITFSANNDSPLQYSISFDDKSSLTIKGTSYYLKDIFYNKGYLFFTDLIVPNTWNFSAASVSNSFNIYQSQFIASTTSTDPLQYLYNYKLYYSVDSTNPNLKPDLSNISNPAVIFNLINQIIFGASDIINNSYYKQFNSKFDTKFMGGIWLTSQLNNLVSLN
jgi:hypothetical protein